LPAAALWHHGSWFLVPEGTSDSDPLLEKARIPPTGVGVPIGRSSTPEDCAAAVLAILRTDHRTEHCVVLDGGSTLACRHPRDNLELWRPTLRSGIVRVAAARQRAVRLLQRRGPVT